MKEDNFESPEKEIDVKLVREIEKFMYHLNLRENTPPIPDEYIDDTTIYKIAQYFYELGQKDAADKFDEIEYNRQREQEKMLDKGLDGAAEEYAWKELPDESSSGEFGTGDYFPPVDMEYPREIATDAFIAGAKWQKERMLKDAVEGEAEELYNDGEIHCTVGVGTYFKPGEMVYVIKAEEEDE